MNLFQEYQRNVTRRYFFKQGSHAVGWAALASLMGTDGVGGSACGADSAATGTPGVRTNLQHFAAKAKHVIYLHMVGGPHSWSPDRSRFRRASGTDDAILPHQRCQRCPTDRVRSLREEVTTSDIALVFLKQIHDSAPL